MHKNVVDVHLILWRQDGAILLAERAGGYGDGLLNVPGGKLEPDEDVLTAALREATEELDVHVRPEQARFASVVHHRSPAGEARIGFFFVTRQWEGTPRNVEPHKCRRLTWEDPDALPPQTIAYTAAGLRAWRSGGAAALDGWSRTSREIALPGLDLTILHRG